MIHWVAVLAALLIFLAPPSINLWGSYERQRGLLQSEAKAHASAVNGFINRHPETWRFEPYRLWGLVGKVRTGDRKVCLLDEKGEEVTALGGDLAPPILQGRERLYAFGQPVGWVQVELSGRKALIQAGVIGFLCLLLGLGAFHLLRTVPIRALEEAMRSLRLEKERAQVTLGSIGDGVIRCDLEGRVETINPEACRLTGWSAKEALGQSMDEIYQLIREDDGPAPDLVETCLAHGEAGGRVSSEGAVLLESRDGKRRPVADLAAPIHGETGGIEGVVLIFRDVSESRRMEQALQEAKEKAEKANRAKSLFLAHMSHEIRSPLNAILGVNDLLLETPIDAEQRRFIGTSRKAGDSLLALISDVLDISKIEADQLALESAPFDLLELLETSVEIKRGLAEEKGLACRLQCDHMVPRWVRGDQVRLRQVLLNLLGNAIKFTSSGSVTLSAVRETGEEGERVRFRVEDTGIGIADDKQGAVFQSFTQADSATTRRFGGAGLGLAISLNLVEAMGGRLAVESAVGRGSAFYFSIPLIEEAAPRITEQSAPRPVSSKGSVDGERTILLVDDAPDNRMVIEAFLRGSPFRVVTAEDGAEALESFKSNSPDLVLMDMMMPVLDGFEATRGIRDWEAAHGRHRAPIIALTAQALKEDLERALAAGCDMHITKPVRKARLLEAIDGLINA